MSPRCFLPTINCDQLKHSLKIISSPLVHATSIVASMESSEMSFYGFRSTRKFNFGVSKGSRSLRALSVEYLIATPNKSDPSRRLRFKKYFERKFDYFSNFSSQCVACAETDIVFIKDACSSSDWN